MSDDPEKELRSDLERLASTVGDPPEHGLERVAARRHRRLRRRRGAVATAAVLAVLSVVILAVEGRRDSSDTVTAPPPPGGPPAPRVELPRALPVLCDPAGIDVPVTAVRPERDGLHIVVSNTLAVPTVLVVEGDGWASGDVEVQPGASEVRQPVPPGEVTIGCRIDERMERRRVDLVDQGGYYRAPELGCDDAEVVVRHDLPVAEPGATNIIAAARSALDSHLVGGTAGDAIGAVRGYQSQRLGDPTDDPVVQLAREGDTAAFVHLRGADGSVSAPWVVASEVEVCAGVLVDPPPEATTTTTTATTDTTGRPAVP